MSSQPNDFETKVIEVLARLDTKMDTLIGAEGQEGRVPALEKKVDDLRQKTWVAGGALLGMGGLLHWAIDLFRTYKAH